jgi:hypothetical protein
VSALLQGSFGGEAKVILKAKGGNVDPPALGLATPVTVQLRNGNGACFGATYAAPSVNTTERFKARGQ